MSSRKSTTGEDLPEDDSSTPLHPTFDLNANDDDIEDDDRFKDELANSKVTFLLLYILQSTDFLIGVIS